MLYYMANGFLNFFKEPEAKPVIKDKEQVNLKYKHFQRRLFYSLYIGYVVSYIGRKNLSVAMPGISKSFNLANTDLGVLLGTFYVTYGVGKFINGMIADKANVRTFFSTALIMAAISLFCFAISASFSFISISALLFLFSFFWGANGWFQSMTFPPIAKSLTFWYAKKDRGIKWSLISTSHQIGVLASTVITVFAVKHLGGWQAAFYVPGLITLLTGLWMFNRLRDKPVTLGLPEVESYKRSLEKGESLYDFDALKDTNLEALSGDSKKENEKTKDKESYRKLLIKNVFLNPVVWILVISYMFIYIVRTASEDWITKYFVDVRHNDLGNATSKLVVLSIIGAFGTVLAGVISEKIFKGRRAPVNILFLAGLGVSLLAFSTNPAELQVLDYVYSALIGVFTAGLQNLVGLWIVELCSEKVASAANGFAGISSYVGAYLASVGSGYLIDHYGWQGAFMYWIVSTIVALLLILVVTPQERKRIKNVV